MDNKSFQIDLDAVDREAIPATEESDGVERRHRRIFPQEERDTPDAGLNDLKYAIDDKPPWYASMVFGLQHQLAMMSSSIFFPFILANAFCVPEHEKGRFIAHLFSAIVLTESVGTFLQSTFGTRLPIVQGIAFSFFTPASVILATEPWKCSDTELEIQANNTGNASDITYLDRMREIQGATMVAACFQFLLGVSGLISLIIRHIGPLTVAPTITIIGYSIHTIALSNSRNHWGIAFMSMALTIIFSLYLNKVKVPYPWYNFKKKKCFIDGARVFALFPVLLALLITWLLCYILTITDVFPDDPTEPAYLARTDRHQGSISSIPWIWFPIPFRWGLPTVSVAPVLGLCAGALASVMESLGDYYACAAMSGAPPPPGHALNRGISMEGLACLFAGMWGSLGVTSYSQNIGAIAITKVGSRRVIQWASLLLFIVAVIGKIGAAVASLPPPIIGGVMWVMSGVVMSVGVASLQHANMNSSRTLLIYGFAVITGIMVPEYLRSEPGAISTGNFVADQVLDVLCKTGMLLAGVIGFVLDNTIPGTPAERGLTAWRKKYSEGESTGKTMKSYDLPFCMSCIRKWKWTRYVPICPTFLKKND